MFNKTCERCEKPLLDFIQPVFLAGEYPTQLCRSCQWELSSFCRENETFEACEQLTEERNVLYSLMAFDGVKRVSELTQNRKDRQALQVRMHEVAESWCKNISTPAMTARKDGLDKTTTGEKQ